MRISKGKLHLASFKLLGNGKDLARGFKSAIKHDVTHFDYSRLSHIALLAAIALAIFAPVSAFIGVQERYRLTPESNHLIGKTFPALAKKVKLDPATESWKFNDQGKATHKQASEPLATSSKQIGGTGSGDTSMYSATVHQNPAQGVEFTDNATDLTFSMSPSYALQKGRSQAGRMVFPRDDGGKLVYTIKANGIKEDLVLDQPAGDELELQYELNLPKTLEARMTPDGGLGVYSADPVLFGDISIGSEADRAKIESARTSAQKTNLVFALPAPVIKQSPGRKTSVPAPHAAFALSGTRLTLRATGLAKLSYPISIDPSVVITSSTDFSTGNDESNIDFASGQVNRGKVTGGSVGAWTTSANTLSDNVEQEMTASYNGIIYRLGGSNRYIPVLYSTVEYATVTSGSVSAWQATTSLPVLTTAGKAVAYNGYMFLVGGTGVSGNFATTYSAPINSNGTLGAWTATSVLPVTVKSHAMAVYNNFIYVMGGNTTGLASCSSTCSNAVYYAPIKGDGTLGTWNTTTSFTTARVIPNGAAYNGYLYVMGGGNTVYMNDVQYARINDDGTVGTWTATSSFSLARYGQAVFANNGYMYLIGGWAGGTNYRSDIQYASINANGALGSWIVSANTVSGGRFYWDGAVVDGYIYLMGGYDGSADYNDVQSAKIDTLGIPAAFATNSTSYTTNRRGLQTVAYGGYFYVMGGDNGSAPTNTIYAAPFNANGTIGTFTSTGMTSFTTVRTMFTAFAYDGYMYVMGGCSSALSLCTTAGNNLATVYSAPISFVNGTIGTWTARTSFTTARYGHSSVVFGNYVYIMGGLNGSTFKNDVQYAALGASGAITSWTTASATYNVPTARASFGATMSGNQIYIAGGCSAGNLVTCTTSLSNMSYATLNASGGFASTWTTGNAITNARYGLGLAASGSVLYVVGGYDGTTYYSDSQFAPINSSGVPGTWAAGTSIPITRWGGSTIAYNGILYTAGGYNGTSFYANIYYSFLNNGGAGPTGSAGVWAAGSTMTDPRYYASSAVSDGYLYVFGGNSTSSAISSVEYVAINGDGTLGTWNYTTSLPLNLRGTVAGSSNGYVYVMGGNDGAGGFYSDVYYAPINSDGTLGAWTATTSFTTPRWLASGTVYNGHAFIAGGTDGTSTYSDVQIATVNADGTLGTWSSTTSFSGVRSEFGLAAYGDRMYIAGGFSGSAMLADIKSATINTNGTLGSWSDIGRLNTPQKGITLAASDGYLYINGGENANGDENGTFSAAILATGSIAAFQRSSEVLFSGRTNHQVIISQGYIYAIGGFNGGAMSDIEYAPLNSQTRKGIFTKMIDIGGDSGISSISYGGSLPGGLDAITYQLAGNSTAFGSKLQSRRLTGMVPPCEAVSSAHYALISVVLDGSKEAVFPDTASTYANATDITVTYGSSHPTPQIRLNLGKSFQNQEQQPFDTCLPS